MKEHLRIFNIASMELLGEGLGFYRTDAKITNGLIRNNHIVNTFSYDDMMKLASPVGHREILTAKGRKILFRSLEAFDPEVILIAYVKLNDKTCKRIKEICPNAKIIAWYVNPPRISEMKRYHTLSKYIDVLFMTSGGDTVRELKQHFPEMPDIRFFPNVTDEGVDCYRSYEHTDHKNDIIFYGSDGKKGQRGAFLSQVLDQTPTLRWKTAGCFGEPRIFGATYHEALNKSKFGINMAQWVPNEYHLYASNRLAQMTGNGLLTFNQDFVGLPKLFSDKEIVSFDSVDELVEKLHHYHANPDEAVAIAKAGYEKAHQAYSSARVTKFMLEALDGDFSENYEWLDEVY